MLGRLWERVWGRPTGGEAWRLQGWGFWTFRVVSAFALGAGGWDLSMPDVAGYVAGATVGYWLAYRLQLSAIRRLARPRCRHCTHGCRHCCYCTSPLPPTEGESWSPREIEAEEVAPGVWRATDIRKGDHISIPMRFAPPPREPRPDDPEGAA